MAMTDLRNPSVNLYRLQDAVTGEFVHFTCLDRRTKNSREAWIGSHDMVAKVRAQFPHTRNMMIERVYRDAR